MSSWANILKSDAPTEKPSEAAEVKSAESSPAAICVVDANAIINGNLAGIHSFATMVVTLQEVIDEVKDSKSRQFLQALPFTIQVKEASEESVKSVLRFARLTGDIHALSSTDIKLLALAHTLEVAAHGSSHLRDQPVQPKVKSKVRRGGKQLPGWGRVDNPEDWKVVDEADDDENAGEGISRVAAKITELDLGESKMEAQTAAGQSSSQYQEEDEEEEEEEEDEWMTAGKSKNAERRRKRKQMRWEARQLQSATATAPPTTAASAISDEKEDAMQEEDEDDEGEDEGEDEEDEEEGEEDEEMAKEEDGQEEEEECHPSSSPPFEVNTTSSIMSLTSDFAMQNVILQMGMRLVARDGHQVSKLTRWALRCHACFNTVKEATASISRRMFCPKCGGMTMERVEVTVGPDGTEVYGVRKKHCLKGTVFSLPKPKGGRAGSTSNPIQSEDVFNQKLGKKLRRKAKAAEGGETGIDAFAPELAATDAWFRAQAVATGGKGTQFLMTSYKNNPNEAKHNRSNRRG